MKNRRILVTYGYHLGEDFAKDVGTELRKLNLENVIVKGLKGEKPFPKDHDDPNCIFEEWKKSYEDWKKGKIVYPEDLSILRGKVGADLGIDLHDDSPSRDWALRAYERGDPSAVAEKECGEKYFLHAHMEWDVAEKLLRPFIEEWNKAHGRECSGHGCECYYETYHMRKLCKANIIALEYLTVFTDLSVREAINFLTELVKYLQSYE
jgi:hypothetical protein